MANMTLFLDMDGVLCDFDQAFLNLTFEKLGKPISKDDFRADFGFRRSWKLINAKGISFWSDMPSMSDMQILRKFVLANFNSIKILSSAGKPYAKDNMSTDGKQLWLRSHGFGSIIPSNILIVDTKEEKRKYATPEGILVDDNRDNINEWNQAGGIGILHTSADKTIHELKKYG